MRKSKKGIDNLKKRDIIIVVVAKTQRGKEVNLMSYRMLRGKILELYGTQANFAQAMGMNPATLNGKLNNRRQWGADEITKACELLNIPLSDAHLYFFCSKSCENATV